MEENNGEIGGNILSAAEAARLLNWDYRTFRKKIYMGNGTPPPGTIKPMSKTNKGFSLHRLDVIALGEYYSKKNS